MTDRVDRFKEALSLHKAGCVERAEGIYRDLLREDPGHAGAWHLLGMILHGRRDLPAALEHVGKALSLCDSKAVYWNNYGVVLRDLGRHREAKAAFEKAIRIRGEYADAWSNLGLMQTELGLLDEAEKSLRYALRLEPRHGDGLRHLAVICREKGKYEEALRLCGDAAAVTPGRAEVHNVRGSVLTALGRAEDAVGAYGESLSCDSGNAETHLSLGYALNDLGETERASGSFSRAAELRPDRPIWRLRHLGLCPLVFQTSEEITDYREKLERELDEALAEGPQFDWRQGLRDGFVPSFQLVHHGECSRVLKEKFAGLFAPGFPQERPKARARRKIRVGFTCTQGHEGGFLRGFGGIMHGLAGRGLDVVGLVSRSLVPFFRSRFASDEVRWIGFPHSLEGAFRVFHEAECDVVMHWQAGTDGVNYFLPFLPLAPVQCIGFGQHGTTGIPNIDYFVSSELFERGPEADEDYSEQLVQFPAETSWQERALCEGGACRSDYGLPATGALYFCPQRLSKLHPDFDRLLGRVLEADRTGRVVVLAGRRRRSTEALAARLRRSLGEALVRRILFVPSQKPGDYYRLLSLMEVVLDTPAYSASLTGYDAFSLGVPIVTIPGSLMVQRYASGLYRQMGIFDLIASGEEAYVELVVTLGVDVDFRRALSRKIAERSDALFWNHQVIEEYESFFRSIVRGDG